jgi:hypothetical protein
MIKTNIFVILSFIIFITQWWILQFLIQNTSFFNILWRLSLRSSTLLLEIIFLYSLVLLFKLVRQILLNDKSITTMSFFLTSLFFIIDCAIKNPLKASTTIFHQMNFYFKMDFDHNDKMAVFYFYPSLQILQSILPIFIIWLSILASICFYNYLLTFF